MIIDKVDSGFKRSMRKAQKLVEDCNKNEKMSLRSVFLVNPYISCVLLALSHVFDSHIALYLGVLAAVLVMGYCVFAIICSEIAFEQTVGIYKKHTFVAATVHLPVANILGIAKLCTHSLAIGVTMLWVGLSRETAVSDYTTFLTLMILMLFISLKNIVYSLVICASCIKRIEDEAEEENSNEDS